MTVEVKNFEADFVYIKDERAEEKDMAGLNLRLFGRRLLNLAAEFLPRQFNSPEWRKYQMALKSNFLPEKPSNGKDNYKSKKTKIGSSPSPTHQQSSGLSSPFAHLSKPTAKGRNNNNNNTIEAETSLTMKLPILRA